MSKDQILSKCHLWLWNTYPETRGLCWHVPNERKQSKIQGAILKAKGVIPGVPDYVINWSGRAYYIEFKTDIGKQSQDQKDVANKLMDHGFFYAVVRSFEEFQKIVEQILTQY